MNVDDFCEQARWTPDEHARLGLAATYAALHAARGEIAALIESAPSDSRMLAPLRVLFHRLDHADDEAIRRIDWSFPGVIE